MLSEDVLCVMLSDAAQDITLAGVLADALEDSGRANLAEVARKAGNNLRSFSDLRDWAFFAENAGHVVGERLEGALALAKAEELRKKQGIIVAWEHDPEGCVGCDCGSGECPCATGEDHDTEMCLLIDADSSRCLTSLGGICDATPEYRRVVAAELALELAVNFSESPNFGLTS